MIILKPFSQANFEKFISWIDSKELLITIAGNYFAYPLTSDQLQAYVDDKNSYSFNIIDTENNTIIGHAEIIQSGNNYFKIDKLIIGDKSKRGKGTGQIVMNELVNYAFTELAAMTIELNVFDWNTSAIRCYEKTGFVINDQKTSLFSVDDKQWKVLNMVITNKQFLNKDELLK